MVRFISAYMSLQTDQKAVYKVDIKSEIENFKRKNPDVLKPVVIFDFLSTISILVHHYNEVMCGGRHIKCVHRAETLFRKFHDLGADLVFFVDGMVKEIKLPEWLRRKNSEYENQKGLFAYLKAQNPIQYRFGKCMKTYYDNYLRVARKYGSVVISLQNECDLDIAEYATRTKALAVVAHDSDFLIMPGDWLVWISDTLNPRNMSVDVWDKKKLRESLGLEPWQMPILATLSGCVWIEFKHVKHLRQQYSGNLVDVEKALAGFIRRTFQNDQDLNIRLADLIYNGGCGELPYQQIEELVDTCLNFYNCTNPELTQIEPDWLRKHILETASCYVYSIYYQMVLQVPHSFVDISKDNASSFSDLVLPLICREVGIMFSGRREVYPDLKQRVGLKPSENEPFCIKEYTPIYPDFEVPAMEDILSNDQRVSLEKRVEILSWVVSPNCLKLSVDHVPKLLKTIFIVPALIVNYLVQERVITADDADILLLTILEASKLDNRKADMLRGPETVKEHPFWLSHLYTNLVHYFDEAMIFCGLHMYVPHNYFDGYIFHKIYAKFLGMTIDEKLKKRMSISDYRLFTL